VTYYVAGYAALIFSIPVELRVTRGVSLSRDSRTLSLGFNSLWSTTAVDPASTPSGVPLMDRASTPSGVPLLFYSLLPVISGIEEVSAPARKFLPAPSSEWIVTYPSLGHLPHHPAGDGSDKLYKCS